MLVSRRVTKLACKVRVCPCIIQPPGKTCQKVAFAFSAGYIFRNTWKSIPPYCMYRPMQCYRNENPPKKLGFKLDDRLQGGTLRKSRSNNPHFPNNLPQLVFLKRFLQKKIKSWRTNGNHGISASNLLEFGKALWKFKQQSVRFSLLRSPFHPSGHLVNRTSKGEFIPSKSLHRSFLQDSSLAVACQLQRCSHWINRFPKDLVLFVLLHHFEQEPPVAFFEILLG